MKPLGRHQINVLKTMVRMGGWPGGGWNCTNRSVTVRLLESLVKRGMVRKRPSWTNPDRFRYTVVRPDFTTNDKDSI